MHDKNETKNMNQRFLSTVSTSRTLPNLCAHFHIKPSKSLPISVHNLHFAVVSVLLQLY